MKKTMVTMVMVSLICGCTSLYTGIVTITQVRDSALKELASLHKQGKISLVTDTKISQADATYRASAETTEKALVAYQSSGDKGAYVAALQATKQAVTGILDILTPLIDQQRAVKLQAQLLEATKL